MEDGSIVITRPYPGWLHIAVSEDAAIKARAMTYEGRMSLIRKIADACTLDVWVIANVFTPPDSTYGFRAALHTDGSMG